MQENIITFSVPLNDKLIEEKTKVLKDNLNFRFPHWRMVEYVDGYTEIRIVSGLDDWRYFQITMWIINGLFDTQCSYLFLSMDGIESRKSLYETRHWYQGTGHEPATKH